MINLFYKILKINKLEGRPIISFEIKKEGIDYVIVIKNTGDGDGIIDSIRYDYTALPFMIKPKIKAKIGMVIHSQEELIIDMPEALGTNFIDAMCKFDFSYSMPKLIINYSDFKRNKYTAQYFFVGEESI